MAWEVTKNEQGFFVVAGVDGYFATELAAREVSARMQGSGSGADAADQSAKVEFVARSNVLRPRPGTKVLVIQSGTAGSIHGIAPGDRELGDELFILMGGFTLVHESGDAEIVAVGEGKLFLAGGANLAPGADQMVVHLIYLPVNPGPQGTRHWFEVTHTAVGSGS
jgi:hypothetical protein